MSNQHIVDQAENISKGARGLSDQASDLALNLTQYAGGGAEMPFFVVGLTVFVLACFVGYYVVWRVTPALHSPLMAVTNAISSVIIVGGLIAAAAVSGEVEGPRAWIAKGAGVAAVTLASVNIFGGFMVTRRMLAMYKKKERAG